MSNDPLGKGPGRREGVVAEEPDNLGKVPQPRLCGLHFPVVDRGFIHPELLSDLKLEKTEVESALAEVVTCRNKLSGIGLAQWFGRHPAEVTKGQ